MIIGVPGEIKSDERRVALTPAGAAALVAHGHEVIMQSGAGVGSGFLDESYADQGARVVAEAAEVWSESDMILKVKEPLAPEFELMREDLILFTYLHLAADRELTRRLLERRVIGIAYETIQLADGGLPLLAPMSEVAGSLAVQVGAHCLEKTTGGKGILVSGVAGVPPARVTIIGAGVAGTAACHLAAGMGARVSVLDVNAARLRYVHDIFRGGVTTVMSNRANIFEYVVDADLVIGSVLIPGARAPRLVTEAMIEAMEDGSVFVDIAIDQGGCSETSRPTSHSDPTYVHGGVVHYCVTNMPGIVPRTSALALTNATLSYALEIADLGVDAAMAKNPALARGLNTRAGKIEHPAVAEAYASNED